MKLLYHLCNATALVPQGGSVCVCMHFCDCVSLYHLADTVHRAGGHWEVSNRSGLRGATLQNTEEVLCASDVSFSSAPVTVALKCIKPKLCFITL